MKKGIFKNILMGLALTGLLSACMSELDQQPIDPDVDTPEEVLNSEEAFFQVLAKVYAGFAVSGQQGPSGNGDLSGFDEGHSQYWRGYFVCQELPTDECINGWADGNLPKMSQITWGADNEFIRSFYYRALYQVSVANEFIRQANEYGKEEYTNLDTYIAEARFLRALAYWHALDLFGNGIPFVTEADAIGSTKPQPAGEVGGSELFEFIESELLEITGENGTVEQELLDARSTYVGRADKAAGWMLLAKLYLNHKSYISENTDYYTKGLDIINKVIASGYRLVDDSDVADGDVYTPYEFLFNADNYRSSDEIIYSINIDGIYAKSYGSTTYILNAAIGGEMTPQDYGTSGGWGGNRTTSALVNKFAGTDLRALWYTNGQSLEITEQDQFTQGYAVIKYKNKTRSGEDGSNMSEGFADINIPVFRLADAYLMAAEFEIRAGGTASAATTAYLQEIWDRAGILTALPEITLDWLLDERARELYWECHRRTDLIRFDKFTSGYNWPFKGNVAQGQDVADKFKLMPIPTTDLIVNTNLKQNPDY